ncbi:MAG: helix-turn-helix domain-containing protein [Clostridiales bacterium]|nr:helix-turn-helix domain-containing protein [Clostridiales bacterium]
MATPRTALSVAELAESIGVSETVAYGLVKRRDFPAVKLGGRWIVPIDDLRAWLSQQAQNKDAFCTYVDRPSGTYGA